MNPGRKRFFKPLPPCVQARRPIGERFVPGLSLRHSCLRFSTSAQANYPMPTMSLNHMTDQRGPTKPTGRTTDPKLTAADGIPGSARLGSYGKPLRYVTIQAAVLGVRCTSKLFWPPIVSSKVMVPYGCQRRGRALW